MTDQLHTGQRVRVRRDSTDEWAQAAVALASSNGRSVMLLLLDLPVRGAGGLIAGALPLIVDYEAETVTSIFGDPYQIEVSLP